MEDDGHLVTGGCEDWRWATTTVPTWEDREWSDKVRKINHTDLKYGLLCLLFRHFFLLFRHFFLLFRHFFLLFRHFSLLFSTFPYCSGIFPYWSGIFPSCSGTFPSCSGTFPCTFTPANRCCRADNIGNQQGCDNRLKKKP